MTVEELERVLTGHDDVDLFAALEVFVDLIIDPEEGDEDE
jgi:hypothetical protein